MRKNIEALTEDPKVKLIFQHDFGTYLGGEIMSNVSYISSTDSKIQYEKESTAANNNLDKDAFLKLLVTQLRYQDPLNPTNDKEFLAQMAQFTALEQMQNMNQGFQATKAFSLLGKQVQATTINEHTLDVETIQGKVEYVKMKNGQPYLVIDNKEVPAEDVEIVTDLAVLGISDEYTNAFELIDKVVQFTRTNPNNNKKEYIEGSVRHINMKNGTPYVVVGSGDAAIEAKLDLLENVVEKESLTGKNVIGSYYNNETEEYENVQGKVEYILIRDEITYAIVNGREISLKDIEKVYKN